MLDLALLLDMKQCEYNVGIGFVRNKATDEMMLMDIHVVESKVL